MGKKSQQNALFSDFPRKNRCSHGHFLSKNGPFCEKHIAHAHILSKKRPFPKHNAFMSFFFKFSKNPCFHAQDRSTKRQFYKNYTLLWSKKVNRIPLFSEFSRKNYCSHAHIWSKKRPFSKNQTALMSIFSQKKRPFSQKYGALMSFFLNFT